jgi:hypothetical protein
VATHSEAGEQVEEKRRKRGEKEMVPSRVVVYFAPLA